MARSSMQGLMCAAALWLLSGAAAVQLAHAAPPGYQTLIREAVEEYDLGHWTEAKVFFSRAHALYPNARTERGLGLSCYELGEYVQSIAYLKASLRNPVQPLTAAMQVDLARLVAQARQFVSRVDVALEPAQARLDIDGVPAGPSDEGGWLLDPGEHELQASAPGFVTLRRSLRAGGGSELHLRLVLESSAADQTLSAAGRRGRAAMPDRSGAPGGSSAGEPSLTSASAQELQPPSAPEAMTGPAAQSGKDLAPWLIVGASAACVVAGVVFVAVAAHDKSAVEHPHDPSGWSTGLESTYNQGRAFFPLGFALGAAGLAGVASGLAWRYWPPSAEASSLQVSVTPLGAAMRARF
jgi:hypothetical protein